MGVSENRGTLFGGILGIRGVPFKMSVQHSLPASWVRSRVHPVGGQVPEVFVQEHPKSKQGTPFWPKVADKGTSTLKTRNNGLLWALVALNPKP